MNTLVPLVAVLFYTVTLQALPDKQEPLDCERLATLWYSKYVKDFSIKWDTKKFHCPGTEGLLAQTFLDLETVAFVTNETNYSPNFYQYVKKNVTATIYDPSCKFMAMGAGGEVTLCPAFFRGQREDRASTLVHEGRHMDSNDPSHETCTRGPYKGEVLGCDAEFFDGDWKGSGFNAEVFYYSWVIQGARKNELRRSVIQSYLNYLIPNRFNKVDPSVLNKWRE